MFHAHTSILKNLLIWSFKTSSENHLMGKTAPTLPQESFYSHMHKRPSWLASTEKHWHKNLIVTLKKRKSTHVSITRFQWNLTERSNAFNMTANAWKSFCAQTWQELSTLYQGLHRVWFNSLLLSGREGDCNLVCSHNPSTECKQMYSTIQALHVP